MRWLHGFPLVVAATAVAGAAGYLITWWVAREIGLVAYPVFAVFWAFMYVLIGSLAGIQQELTRATLPNGHHLSGGHNHHARNFALVAAGVVAVLVIGTAPVWVDVAFPSVGWALVWPLAVGAGSWVLVATIAGSFYGTSQWTPIAAMVVLDPVLRLIALVIALSLTHDVVVLGWLVALPVPTVIAVLWPMLRPRLRRVPEIDVGLARLTWNVMRTVIAAAALSLMVSGLPLLFRISTRGHTAQLGLVILTVTLTRAPLIVTVMSLQSFLIVRFRDRTGSLLRAVLALFGIVGAAAVVLAVLGSLVGPAVFGWLFPNDPRPQGGLIAVLVGSSALVAGLCITAAATLAKSKHLAYSIGWVLAASVTVFALYLPLALTSRVVVALVAGPVCGLVVHFFALAAGRRTLVPSVTEDVREE